MKTTDEHYELLSSYRDTKEYWDYRVDIGWDNPTTPQPEESILNRRWEISEETYHYFMDVLPPLRMGGSYFIMCEFTFGDYTNVFTQDGDRYYCGWVNFREWSKKYG